MIYVTFVYDERIEDGFHGFVTKNNHLLHSAIGAVSTEIRSKEIGKIFLTQTDDKIVKTASNAAEETQ